MNKQERMSKSMDELNDMLANIEREVRKAGLYSLEYEIQLLQKLMCSVREGLVYYSNHGIEDEEE